MSRIAVGLVLCWATVAAAEDRPPVGATAVVDRAVAVVNRVPVWQSEIDELLRMQRADGTPEARRVALDSMIDNVLLLAAADARHIDAAPDEVDAALNQIKTQNNVDDAGLDKVLADYGFTRARYRVELARQLKIQKFALYELKPRVVVSDDDIRRAYAEAKAANPALGPLDAAMKATVESSVYAAKMAAEQARWLERERRAAHIERRP